MAKNKTGKKSLVGSVILTVISLVLIVGMIIANIVTTSYEQVINIALGTETTKVTAGDANEDTEYYKSDYADQDEVKAAGKEVAEELTEEGAVLLKNDDQALPIAANAKVSLFGHSSVNMIVCGTGSADIDASEAPTFKEALESRGVEVNPSLWSFYEDNIDNYKTNPEKGDNSIRSGDGASTDGYYTVNEIPWSEYTDAAKADFANYNDAAIVVISRLGGEMYDISSDTDSKGNPDETVNGSGNALELTIQERELLQQVSSQFDKTIVLINSTNALECDFVDDASLGVDAVMWIGYTGVVGLYGVSDLLVGNANPSGRLVDTYCVDNTTSPSYVNFTTETWTNADELGDLMFDFSLDSNMYYNVYQEGIYVGYRYYETRYEDYVLGQGNAGNYDYTADVKYPFGYGLSYTSFEYSDFSLTENDDSFDITVTVTNTGDYAGKDVVEVYMQSPYTDYDKANGIEKAAIELCGFAKTSVMDPGASETVTVNVSKEELRTYDAYNEKTYIVDEGVYYFAVGSDAHEALNSVLYVKGADESKMTSNGNSDLVYMWVNDTMDTTTYAVSNDGEEDYAITNQFDNADLNLVDGGEQQITYLTRSDWTGTFPKETVKLELTEGLQAEMTSLKEYEITETDAEMPTMGADNGMTLAMMIGKDYDDPDWEDLLDQVTYDEMASLIGVGYHGTKSVESVAKPRTVDENGPQGFTKKLTDVLGNSEPLTAYTDENIMAATWNTDYMYTVGQQIGEDGLALGIVGLYGPAMNTHRSPYAGRNFEYYSEDGYLAGKIAAAEVSGIQSKGVYVYIKHYALNDQETNCRCYSIFANEQAIREIYLEPFKHAVVEGGAMNVMNSFARVGVVWSGAHEGLMTEVLRNEWGMKGFALTDYSNTGNTFDIKLGVMAGTDAWDCSAEGSGTWSAKLAATNGTGDAALAQAMRQATHRILYVVANSAAMNGLSTSSKIVKNIPWWRALIYAVLALGVILLALSIFLIAKKVKYNKNLPAEVLAQIEAEKEAKKASGSGRKKGIIIGVIVAVIAVAGIAVFALTRGGSGSGSSAGTDTGAILASYYSEGKYNSDEVNQFKYIALLDDETYVCSVKSLDSKDLTTETVNLVMKGKYTLDGDLLTIEPGYGYTVAMNGDTPIEMELTPDNTAMAAACLGTSEFVFKVTADGTFEVAEDGATASTDSPVYGNGVKDSYYCEGYYNSDEVNQFKYIVILDDDTFICSVKSLDSKDMTTETVNYVMKGSYVLDGDKLTLTPGYGYTLAMNGDTPIEMPMTPDNTAMSAACLGTSDFVFTVDEDAHTFDIAE